MTKSVLIIDDSPSVRRMVSMTLEGAGYDVTQAEDGAQGLATAKSRRFDMVITDQNMPNMTGIEFIKAYRGDPSSSGVPILFLSTESEGSLKDEARAAGALGWIPKPFEQTKLLAVAKKVLGA
ncbi:two-component system response regulator [Meridianimarinicoccus roseus]|jgi:two-component system chemotaxis response regulator CheY|uniref:Two-component system response regulator n=1 Tax=Meridianimarinicoccus roseus TaxID=2072018 RepID=A0A2V2LCB7_9RHOB|nr:response regulator [Meridianimarinicoccus roseus]PWR01164.1 two-component system response regulator [Meridianimarinicoccus roseus]